MPWESTPAKDKQAPAKAAGAAADDDDDDDDPTGTRTQWPAGLAAYFKGGCTSAGLASAIQHLQGSHAQMAIQEAEEAQKMGKNPTEPLSTAEKKQLLGKINKLKNEAKTLTENIVTLEARVEATTKQLQEVTNELMGCEEMENQDNMALEARRLAVPTNQVLQVPGLDKVKDTALREEFEHQKKLYAQASQFWAGHFQWAAIFQGKVLEAIKAQEEQEAQQKAQAAAAAQAAGASTGQEAAKTQTEEKGDTTAETPQMAAMDEDSEEEEEQEETEAERQAKKEQRQAEITAKVRAAAAPKKPSVNGQTKVNNAAAQKTKGQGNTQAPAASKGKQKTKGRRK